MKTKPIYVTPEELEAYFERYKEWVANNPILVQDYVGNFFATVLLYLFG